MPRISKAGIQLDGTKEPLLHSFPVATAPVVEERDGDVSLCERGIQPERLLRLRPRPRCILAIRQMAALDRLHIGLSQTSVGRREVRLEF